MGILLVYISTDYVFDGTKPPYKIDDTPNPLNKYAVTKLQGEVVTLKHNPSKIINALVLWFKFESIHFYSSELCGESAGTVWSHRIEQFW